MSSSEDIRRAGDHLLAATEEMKALTRRADKVISLLERLAPDVHDLRQTFEGEVIHELRSQLASINERLAVISSEVDDVEKAQREATGRIQVPVAKESSGQVAKAVKAVGRLSPETIRALSLLVFAAGAATGIGFALYKIITAMAGK
jgi:chromosome segregation ATPase